MPESYVTHAGEFCITVGPVIRTAGILAQSVKGTAGCYPVVSRRLGLYASLIGFNPHRLKAPEKEMSSHAMDLAVYAKSSSSCRESTWCCNSNAVNGVVVRSCLGS